MVYRSCFSHAVLPMMKQSTVSLTDDLATRYKLLLLLIATESVTVVSIKSVNWLLHVNCVTNDIAQQTYSQ